MSKLYKHPNGDFMPYEFKRQIPAKGFNSFIRKCIFLTKIWKHIVCKRKMEGEKPTGYITHLDLVKLPEWQKGNENRRFKDK